MPDVRSAGMAGEHSRAAKLDHLFESRVQAATAESAVSQNRGQGRIWLFAGGLFLASLGGIAAAYHLVGPPAANPVSGSVVGNHEKLATASLIIETGAESEAVAQLPGLDIVTNVSASPPIGLDAPAHSSDTASLATSPASMRITDETSSREAAPPDLPAQKVETVDFTPDDEASQTDPGSAAVAEPTPDVSPVKETVTGTSERMVHIVAAAVSGETEVKTNVNVSKVPGTARKSIGQWLAVPAETGLSDRTLVTAATSQQATEAKPAETPVKTQQELFRSFQAYLESTGNAAIIDQSAQKELFNKFIRWSVEGPGGD